MLLIKRYQECNFLTRMYRRLKYQPYYFIKALYLSFKYLYRKDLGEKASFVFSILYQEWQCKAEWYYTEEEVWQKLKIK